MVIDEDKPQALSDAKTSLRVVADTAYGGRARASNHLWPVVVLFLMPGTLLVNWSKVVKA
jgi:hypothetical protein